MAGCHRAGGPCPPRRGKPQGTGRGGYRPDRGGQPEAERGHPHQVRRRAAGGGGRSSGRWPVPRRPHIVQGSGLHGRGRGDGVRARAAARPVDPGDVLSGAPVSVSRLHRAGADQRTGARHHGDHRAAKLPGRAQPVGSRSLDGRLVGRLGRRGGVRHGRGGARQRRRRLHPHPGQRVRAGRAQANPRAGEPGTCHRGGMGRAARSTDRSPAPSATRRACST